MRYTFVGDLHGKSDVVRHALDKEGKIVFVGDYVDSFDKGVEYYREVLDLVLGAVESGKAEALYGNHELSYLKPIHRCSGYSHATHGLIAEYKERMWKNLKPFLELPGNYLVTHAGMHPIVHADFVASGKSMKDWAEDATSAAHWIGRSRGGPNTVGGIFWCDFNREFEPVESINQIFGHTAGGETIRTRHAPNSMNFCIDCLDKNPISFLELEF
jgi:hypothetical protein